MAFDGYSAFHPNPQVRRSREKMRAEMGHKPNDGKGHEDGGDDHDGKDDVSKKAEMHKKEDGSYHTILHHEDGHEEHADHGSYGEAEEHMRAHMDDNASDGGDDQMEEFEQQRNSEED